MKLKTNEMLKKNIPLNLQFFAEGEGETRFSDAKENEGEKTEDKNEKVELSSDELQKKIEAESDRKLEKALKKKQEEWEAETEKKIQEAIEEKERLSKLSEKEQKEEKLSKREKELAKRIAEIERREMLTDAVGILREKELPTEFAEVMLAKDAEKTLENINILKKHIDDTVKNIVNEKYRQSTPEAGNLGAGNEKVNSIAEMRNKDQKQVEEAPNPWG